LIKENKYYDEDGEIIYIDYVEELLNQVKEAS